MRWPDAAFRIVVVVALGYIALPLMSCLYRAQSQENYRNCLRSGQTREACEPLLPVAASREPGDTR
jgi:hypothetical protein